MVTAYFQDDLSEGIAMKVNATSNALIDAILWSANSTDTGFRNEKWERKSSGSSDRKLEGSTTYAYYASDYRTSNPDLKYQYTERARTYAADNDESFVK